MASPYEMLTYVFDPKEDITPYEIALLLKRQVKLNETLRCPKEIMSGFVFARHFREAVKGVDYL